MNETKMALLAVAALFSAAGCQFHASAGGSGSQSPSSHPPPPPNQYQGAPGTAPKAAPMPGQRRPPTSTVPTPPRYTLPNGDTVPVITAPNSFGNGDATQDSLRGLVYAIPVGSTRLPDLASIRPIGALYTRTLDVTERDFREGFPGIENRNEWFAIRYEGTFYVSKTAPYSFRLRTDDGSVLYVDDIKLLDNDGLHGPGGGAKVMSLSAGSHRIRVDYFQGGQGRLALQLFTSEVDRAERPFSTSF